MSDFSRRDFFKSFLPEKKEQTESIVTSLQNEIIFLGSLSDFPVGVDKTVKFGEESYIVSSCEQGIKIKSFQKNEYYLLSLIKGQIVFQPGKIVSSSKVLSIMTGEMNNEEGGQCG